ncbi:MAG: molybdenum cofactor biosynthesis protein MoaE [Luminiphilus sp.]|nr:molybdenum cofactor biosynthesis protein MoaE [Luminiphilus sp.]
MTVLVTKDSIDLGSLYQRFVERYPSAAVANFAGHVRDYGDRENVDCLELEAYPEMAISQLTTLGVEAKSRYGLHAWQVVHRYGKLSVGEPIVWVATAADHRADAFAACEFLMDTLKTDAPFWKREHSGQESSWVKVQASDLERKARWLGGGDTA